MNALNLLKKVKIQTLSFEKHPCKDLDIDSKIHYLNGLSLLTNIDENIDEKEQEYLTILITSFGLERSQLEEFLEFAKNPDEEMILQMMEAFMSKDIKYNFLIDAMLIASVDKNYDENEKAVVEQYFEMLKISHKEQKDLKHIYKLFYTQDGNGLFRYFTRNNYIKKERFEYLLDYFKIDFNYELIEDEKKTLEDIEFFKPTFSNTHFANKDRLGYNAEEIAVKPINNAQFCIYLNYALLKKVIEKNGDDIFVFSEDKNIAFEPNNSEIKYKEDEKKFIISDNKHEQKATGMTYVLAKSFIKWLNDKYNCNYTISTLDGSPLVDMSSFTISLKNEFYYNLYSNNNTNLVGKFYDTRHLDNNHIFKGGFKSTFTSSNVSFRVMKLPQTKES